MSEAPDEPALDEPQTTTTTTTTKSARVPLLPRERAAAGLGLGRGLAIIVVVATVVPSVLLVRQARLDREEISDADDIAVPTPTTDHAAAKAALDVVSGRIDAANAAWTALSVRAVNAERGDRLRVVSRLIAKARDARRAAGQTGAELRGPFPANELGDLSALGLGDDRWLIARDGAAIAPAGVSVPAGLATTGRDEEFLELAVDGATLVRRCVANESYCVVDVDRGAVAAPIVDLTVVRAALSDGLVAPSIVAAASPTSVPPRSAPARSTSPLLLLAAVLSIAGGAYVAWKLSLLSTSLRRRGWRLRGALSGRATDADVAAVAEVRELDAAIDDAVASLGDHVSQASLQHHRRERVLAAAAALDDARDRGGVPRLAAHDDDDANIATLTFSVNALLDVLDARATRFKMAVDDVDGAMKVLTPLAQRLLRLARLPELPSQAADELTSLGTAVGQRARRGGALPTVVDEAARLAPASGDLMGRADAMRPLPADEALRLGVAAQRGATNSDNSEPNAIAESPSTPPRPSL